MDLVPRGQLSLNYLRSAYPFQLQPTLSLPDVSLNAVFGNAVALDGVVIDRQAGCLYAQPMFVPHNQVWGSGGLIDDDAYVDPDLPNWVWDTDSTHGGDGQCFRAKHYGHQVLDFVWNSSGSPAAAAVVLKKELSEGDGDDEPDDRIQGFVAIIARTIYNRIPAGAEPFYEVRWKIVETWYSVNVTPDGLGKFRTSTDGGSTWKVVKADLRASMSITATAGNSTPENGQGQVPLEVLFLNGVLQLRFGGQTAPYLYRIDGVAEPVISQVEFRATCWTQLRPEIHPICFATAASLTSNPLELGFSPDASTPPYYFLTGTAGIVKRASGAPWNVSFPLGSSITVTRTGAATDETQQYDLAIANPSAGTYQGNDYALRTAAVCRVMLHVDGIWASVPADPANVIPRSLTETTTFDPNALTVRQQVQFTLNNLHGAWSGQSGNIAVQLQLGYTQPDTGLYPRFTGICGDYEFTRMATNQAEITFCCKDLMSMLEREIIWTSPVMDGWNHYYAVAFIAQCAGISVDQMAFASLIPSDPYSASGYDPAPYFLPSGDGLRPWTPRNREMRALDLLDYLRKPTGYLLFFDAQGFLRYEPWIPPSATPPSKEFTQGATGTDGENLTEYFWLRLRSSVEDVRNLLLLLGIDPYDPRWRLIVEKREDTGSIYAAPGEEPANYVGYKAPFVWTDARFADPEFAAQAADRLYELLRIPGLDLTFETWMQPQLYPMDVILIDEPTSGTTGIPFYILSVTHHWSYGGQGEQLFRSTITGKFLL